MRGWVVYLRGADEGRLHFCLHFLLLFQGENPAEKKGCRKLSSAEDPTHTKTTTTTPSFECDVAAPTAAPPVTGRGVEGSPMNHALQIVQNWVIPLRKRQAGQSPATPAALRIHQSLGVVWAGEGIFWTRRAGACGIYI